jgi:hypothetical protein
MRLLEPSLRQDRVDPLEVGEHEDVEQLGTGSRAEGVEAGTELALDLLRFTGPDASTRCGPSSSARRLN